MSPIDLPAIKSRLDGGYWENWLKQFLPSIRVDLIALVAAVEERDARIAELEKELNHV